MPTRVADCPDASGRDILPDRPGQSDAQMLFRHRRRFRNRPFWRGVLDVLGPGLITGAADDDPSGIATYSQAGAQFGFALSWVMLVTWPLMAAIQEVSARLGRVTGKGIAANLRQHYPTPVP
jgi:Mn2+/Fe2+ NRAMP family transporter